MWNILAHAPHMEKDSFAARLKTIWLQPTKKTVLMLIDKYRDLFPRAITILEEDPEAAFQYRSYCSFDHLKITFTTFSNV